MAFDSNFYYLLRLILTAVIGTAVIEYFNQRSRSIGFTGLDDGKVGKPKINKGKDKGKLGKGAQKLAVSNFVSLKSDSPPPKSQSLPAGPAFCKPPSPPKNSPKRVSAQRNTMANQSFRYGDLIADSSALSDLATPGQWIDDSIIGIWEIMCEEYFPSGEDPKLFQLVRPTILSLVVGFGGFAEMGVEVTGRYIFMPISDGMGSELGERAAAHWTLLVVNRATGQAFHYDTLNGYNAAMANTVIVLLTAHTKEPYTLTAPPVLNQLTAPGMEYDRSSACAACTCFHLYWILQYFDRWTARGTGALTSDAQDNDTYAPFNSLVWRSIFTDAINRWPSEQHETLMPLFMEIHAEYTAVEAALAEADAEQAQETADTKNGQDIADILSAWIASQKPQEETNAQSAAKEQEDVNAAFAAQPKADAYNKDSDDKDALDGETRDWWKND